MSLGERLRRLDRRVLGDPPPLPPEVDPRTERRMLVLAVVGLPAGVLVGIRYGEPFGFGVAMTLTAPYTDVVVQRWMRRRQQAPLRHK